MQRDAGTLFIVYDNWFIFQKSSVLQAFWEKIITLEEGETMVFGSKAIIWISIKEKSNNLSWNL